MKKQFTVKDLPPEERPRERLKMLGPEALSSTELLAIIMSRGVSGESVVVTAQRLLKKYGDLKGIAAASVEELADIRGIGMAKACQIRAAFEMASRLANYAGDGGQPVIKTPEDVATLVGGRLRSKKKEYFLAILLDTKSRLIKVAEIAIGSLDTSIVHPREAFKEAISASAASLILVHNHPSGDTTPSEDDLLLTGRLAAAGRVIGIDVLDHIILAGNSFISLKRQGLFNGKEEKLYNNAINYS